MKKNLLLLSLIFLLAIIPFFLQKGAAFTGSDDQAKKAITEVNPGYNPWFTSLWNPPSGEAESLLFSLQAAMGAGFIGYFIGYSKGKKTKRKESEERE